MIRTMYTVNRSMNVLQKKQENTSGNISNSNTPGYKFKSLVQSTLESHEMINHAGGKNRDKRQVLGQFVFGNQIDEEIIHIEAGTPYETGNFTDFAIQGDGYFTVELANGGIGYTRNGNFRINEEGHLVTQTGERVLATTMDNQGAPVYIHAEKGLEIDNKGVLDGYFIGNLESRLLISELNNLDDIIDLGNSLYTTNGGARAVDNPIVMQNYLESSNVDYTKEIIDMIQISREFESNQKMIQAADETLSKAVNEIGRL